MFVLPLISILSMLNKLKESICGGGKQGYALRGEKFSQDIKVDLEHPNFSSFKTNKIG